MCRQTRNACSLLGTDPSAWSRYEPLPAVPAVLEGFEHFETAVRFAADGNREAARRALAKIDSAALLEWYIEHAQISGSRRLAILGRKGTSKPAAARDKLSYPG